MYPFERFSQSAKRALALAQAEAERLHQSLIGSEHLLVGLVGSADGLAARVLARLGIREGEVRSAIQAALPDATPPSGSEGALPTSRLKTIIEMAFEESRRAGCNYVGTHHLLLAMVSQGEGLAAPILSDHGVPSDRVREELEAMGPQEPERRRTAVLQSAGIYPAGRFTDNAQRALMLAQEEADGYSHSYIGTEHLLLGLLGVADGTAAQVLGRLGIDGARVRSTIEHVLGHSEIRSVHVITPTSRVKKVIEIAIGEAHRAKTTCAGSEHLLQGLLIEGEGIAAHVLEDYGVTLLRVRNRLEVIDPDA